jgi:class 3 adenylate cyclase/tetratricopeptide (TPR) repeat protein
VSHTPLTGSNPCQCCGNTNRAAARFCDACGTLLSPELASSSKPLLDSELKYITILFGDIVGSTEMVAGHSPDEAQSILTPVVRAMAEAVQAFGGTLNQVLGDGVMALFGAPLCQEDHALRACCAAFRMHEAVAMAHSPTRLRVGLASGLTLLSTPGTGAAGAYPAFGPTIHLASRLQALARPGTTLCAASTRALTGPTVDLVPLGPRALRGFDIQQDVFALVGMRQSVFRFNGSVARGLSPHVGRDRELAELSTVAQTVLTNASVDVVIVGDAGAGKSRLAWEFIRSLRPDTWQVIQAEAVSYGRDVPYQLIGALMRSGFGIDARDEPGKSISRIRSQLAQLDDAAVCAPALLSLLALPLAENAAAWDRLDPLHRRDALRDCVRAVLNALARRRPTLLLIEDLQWADEESLRLLDFRPASDCRLLLVTTHRPDFTPAWAQPNLKVLTLLPLSSESMDRLLQHAFPGITSRALRRALIGRSAGNPFFLEELARDALTAEMPQDGTQDDKQPAIPSTIRAVIAARIDRLAAEDKRVLKTASALGNIFSFRTLREIFSDSSESSFYDTIETLCDAGMFRLNRQSDNEIGFSHALIQEVAYTGLPRAQRRDLHGQIVRTVKRIDSDRLSEQAETLVYHAARGEVWKELIVAARIAGRRAASRSAYVEAAHFFRQGIEACEQLPRSEDILASEIDLRFDLRASLFPTAGIDRSLDNSTQAERLARQLGDKRRLGWATAFLAKDLQLVGRPSAALVTAARALEFSEGDPDLTVAARYFAAQAAYSRGDYASAVTTLRALTSTLEARDSVAWAGTPGPSIIFVRAWLIWSLSRLGKAFEAETAAGEMRRLADDSDLPLCRTIAHLSEGFALAFAGRLPEAEATLRVSLSLCRKWELFAWSTNISSCLGHVLSHLGQFDEAFDLLEQAAERTRRSGIFVSHANELAWLAEAHRLAGHADQAARQAEEAVTVACLHEERGNEALATVVLGEALADLGSIVAGKAHCATALRLAIEIGMGSLIQRCLANLAAFDQPALC